MPPATRKTAPKSGSKQANGAGRHAAAPALRVIHDIPGRLRLRAVEPLDPGAMAALVERLAASPRATRVVGRPNTGSVILEGDRAPGALRALAQEAGIVIAATEAAPHSPPLDQAAHLGLAHLDVEIARQTDGALNFRSALAALLLIGAVVQAARGRYAGPATTLAISALALLDKTRK